MKTIKTILFLAILLLVITINAQTTIQAFDTTIDYDDAKRSCIQVNLDPEPRTLKRAWRDYLKDNYDLKLRGIGFLSNKDILSAEEVKIEQISSNTMDFYTQIIEDENGSEMKVFARQGYDIYLNKLKTPYEYKALREMLESFMKYYLPKYYRNEIKDTEKRINKLTKEVTGLKENIEDNSYKIDKLKREMNELEEAVESNNILLKVAEKKLIKRKEKSERIKTQLKKL